LPALPARRAVCALSVIAHALMGAPETLEGTVLAVSEPAGLAPELVLRAVQRAALQLSEAQT
jgi:hypothetical protein